MTDAQAHLQVEFADALANDTGLNTLAVAGGITEKSMALSMQQSLHQASATGGTIRHRFLCVMPERHARKREGE